MKCYAAFKEGQIISRSHLERSTTRRPGSNSVQYSAKSQKVDDSQAWKCGGVAAVLSAALSLSQPAFAELNKYEAAAGDTFSDAYKAMFDTLCYTSWAPVSSSLNAPVLDDYLLVKYDNLSWYCCQTIVLDQPSIAFLMSPLLLLLVVSLLWACVLEKKTRLRSATAQCLSFGECLWALALMRHHSCHDEAVSFFIYAKKDYKRSLR